MTFSLTAALDRDGASANGALARFGLLLMATVAFVLASQSAGVLFVATATSAPLLPFYRLSSAAYGTGYSAVGIILLILAARGAPGRWGQRVALFFGLLMLALMGIREVATASPYGVDSVAHARHATSLLLTGDHPYRDFSTTAALARYPVVETSVTRHIDDTLMDHFTYPAGAFLSLVPFALLGDLDPRLLYAGSFFLLTLLILAKASAPLRPLVLGLVLLHHYLNAWHIGAGIAEPWWLLLVVAAWEWRDRPLAGGAALGWAIAVKQLAWFFVPFFLIAVYRRAGLRAAVKSGAVATAIFGAANLPFFLADPTAWGQGVLGPMMLPLPALGFGLSRVGTILFPGSPSSFYTLLELGALAAALIGYWRWGRSAPALAFILPWAPLLFAWRSLSSYFYLLPLAVLLVILERSREEEQEGSTLATGELLALLALAMVTLNIATGFEGFLMWGDLVAHSLSPEDRLGHASMALMLSTLGIGLLVTAAWGRVGRAGRSFAFFCGLLVFCLLTATGLQLIETYEVDTTAAAHFTAQLFLDGLHPYRDFDLLAASTFFNVPEVFRTTLTDGSYMRPMPYPAGSFLTLTPFIALGLPDVRPVYALFHLGLALLLFWLAPRSLKLAALALALGVHAISFSSIGQGYSEPMIILLLAVAWLLLGRAPLGGIALGLAIAVKQNAWFFFPFYIMALYFRHGPKGALTGGRWAVGVFLAMNVPFLWDFPQAWVHVALPYLVFPQGVMGFGPSQLGAALWPDGPVSAVFTLLEAIAGISALAAYWRWGRKTPELGLILPWVPLWFNWIATYNYYYLLPFLTAVGILVSRRESQQQASSLPTGP